MNDFSVKKEEKIICFEVLLLLSLGAYSSLQFIVRSR